MSLIRKIGEAKNVSERKSLSPKTRYIIYTHYISIPAQKIKLKIQSKKIKNAEVRVIDQKEVPFNSGMKLGIPNLLKILKEEIINAKNKKIQLKLFLEFNACFSGKNISAIRAIKILFDKLDYPLHIIGFNGNGKADDRILTDEELKAYTAEKLREYEAALNTDVELQKEKQNLDKELEEYNKELRELFQTQLFIPFDESEKQGIDHLKLIPTAHKLDGDPNPAKTLPGYELMRDEATTPPPQTEPAPLDLSLVSPKSIGSPLSSQCYSDRSSASDSSALSTPHSIGSPLSNTLSPHALESDAILFFRQVPSTPRSLGKKLAPVCDDLSRLIY